MLEKVRNRGSLKSTAPIMWTQVSRSSDCHVDREDCELTEHMKNHTKTSIPGGDFLRWSEDGVSFFAI